MSFSSYFYYTSEVHSFYPAFLIATHPSITSLSKQAIVLSVKTLLEHNLLLNLLWCFFILLEALILSVLHYPELLLILQPIIVTSTQIKTHRDVQRTSLCTLRTTSTCVVKYYHNIH